jgi:hypothetical protein
LDGEIIGPKMPKASNGLPERPAAIPNAFYLGRPDPSTGDEALDEHGAQVIRRGWIRGNIGHGSSSRVSVGPDTGRARKRIRGYGWLTIIAEEIGDRLGGLPALSSRDTFFEVLHLERGGYWLRATEWREEFDLEAAGRVFEALAPALLPGEPTKARCDNNILIYRDPGSVR